MRSDIFHVVKRTTQLAPPVYFSNIFLFFPHEFTTVKLKTLGLHSGEFSLDRQVLDSREKKFCCSKKINLSVNGSCYGRSYVTRSFQHQFVNSSFYTQVNIHHPCEHATCIDANLII